MARHDASPLQTAFLWPEQDVQYRLHQYSDGDIVTDILSNLTLWQQFGNGMATFVNLTKEIPTEIAFDKKTLCAQPDYVPDGKYSGVVILTPAIHDGNFALITDWLTSRVAHLRDHYGAVVVIEKNEGQPVAIGKRKAALHESGAVVPHASEGGGILVMGEYILWIGRQPKEHEMHEVNFLRPQDPKEDKGHFNWRMNLPAQATKKYRRAGFTDDEIDDTAIVYQLTHSHVPPDDVAAAKNGWGVDIHGACGCFISVDTHGTETTALCWDDGCATRSRLQLLAEGLPPLYDLTKTKQLIDTCWCDAQLVQTARLAWHGKQNSRLEINICCPHHGFENGRDYSINAFEVWTENDDIQFA